MEMKTEEYMELRSAEYFDGVRAIASKIRRIQEVMAMNRDSMLGLSAVKFDGAKAKGSPYPDAIPDAVAEYMRLEAKYKEDLSELLAKQREAMSIIRLIDNQSHADLLTYYYVIGMSWQKTARKMDRTTRQLRRMHKAALLESFYLIPFDSLPQMPDAMPPYVR